MSCTECALSLTQYGVRGDGGPVRIGRTLMIPIALASLACAAEPDPSGRARDRTATSAQRVISNAPSCSRLGEDLGASGVLEAGETCSLEIKDAGVLDRLGLELPSKP